MTKLLVDLNGIYRLLEFVMNTNASPFNTKPEKLIMGDTYGRPNFNLPMQLLSWLVTSCVTPGIDSVDCFSPVSRFQDNKSKLHIQLPLEEVKFIKHKLCYTTDLLPHLGGEPLQDIVVHLCWGDKENADYFMAETLQTVNNHRGVPGQIDNGLGVLRRLLCMGAEDKLEGLKIEVN